MLNFTKDSAIVQIWLQQLLNGYRIVADVPVLGNLREIVLELYKEKQGV